MLSFYWTPCDVKMRGLQVKVKEWKERNKRREEKIRRKKYKHKQKEKN
jgi:hypothetical protein